MDILLNIWYNSPVLSNNTRRESMLIYIQSFMRKFLSLSIASIMLASSFLAACSSSSKPSESSAKSTVAESVSESSAESKTADGEGTVLKMLVPGYDSG